MIQVTINDIPLQVKANSTILEAARSLGIAIPTLCYINLEGFHIKHKVGSCRICMVEIAGRPNLAPACCTPVSEGMVVHTNNPRVLHARRTVLQLLLSDHPMECLTCSKSGDCELQKLAAEFEIHDIRYVGEKRSHLKGSSSGAIRRDPEKCVMCRRCETACNLIQTVGALTASSRGFEAIVNTPLGKPLKETNCTFCGQCVSVCPTGALTAINVNEKILTALYRPDTVVVAQTAPSVRVAIGELFGLEAGSISTGKLVAALKKLHFKYVFDTDFAADLTIMEETTELLDRVQNNKTLPILTSCCPAWVNFLEKQFPDLLEIPSSAKSPQQMLGAVTKHIWAAKAGYDPAKVVMVSVMPCVAKKFEASRKEMQTDGIKDVDYVITVRELAALLKESGINLANLKEQPFDNPLGESTGAAAIFGSAGGVLEAVLRTASEMLAGKPLEQIDFQAVRGLDGVRSATVTIGDLELKVAQASGLGNARRLLEGIQRGDTSYHAIEIMACPGGCVNGGGMPYIHGDTSIVEKRSRALYEVDRSMPRRKSHENEAVARLYREHLGCPGSKEAHRLLHTRYFKRDSE